MANRIGNDVSVIDLARGVEVSACWLAAAPHTWPYPLMAGAFIAPTSIHSPGRSATPPQSEVTVIDTRRQMVTERERLPNVAGVFHVASANHGRLVIAAQLRPKNLIPLAHVQHGWVFGNSLSLFGPDIGPISGEVVQVPIDELDRYYTPPFGLAVTPDNSNCLSVPRAPIA